MRLLVEARRRGVLKVATAYMAVSWLTLEVGHTLFNIFELPHAGLQILFLLMALGLPLILLAAWHGHLNALTSTGEAHSEPAHAGHEHTEHAAHTGHAEERHGSKEGPVFTAVFGSVAIVVVGIAIGLRFFGMHSAGEAGHSTEGRSEHATSEAAAGSPSKVAVPASSPAFNPPSHSIAVLPFVNMSGDPGQDYFSDGLSEELLNSLVAINELQVAARTSSFSFKGQHEDIESIAHKLNVGAVLEGSVRKAGDHVRITAQLINAVNGFHLWSHTYDRDLKDVLQLQTDVATAVTSALQATLFGDQATARVQVGGTKNPQAFDAYLRSQNLREDLPTTKQRFQVRAAAISEAIRLDPQYAQAYARRAILSVDAATNSEVGENVHTRLELALADANKAIELAPTLALAYRAKLVVLSNGYLDHQHLVEASELLEKAMALGPGDAEVLSGGSIFMAYLGRFDMAVATARKAVELDPLTANTYKRLALVLLYARNYPASMEAIHRALALDPQVLEGNADLCWGQYLTGQLEAALQTCLQQPDYWLNQTQLAMILDKLHRRPEAEATLAKLKAAQGDDASIQYAEIYSQWGDIPRALDALETAYRVRDPGLSIIQSDPNLDPIREQRRFKAIVEKIGFPP